MKKIYTVLALAAVVASSASAKKDLGTLSVQKMDIEKASVVEWAPASSQNGMAKAAMTAADIKDFYLFQWYSAFDQYENPVLTSMTVFLDGNKATVSGLCAYAELEGTFDPEAGTITIPEQPTGYKASEDGSDIMFYVFRLADGSNYFSDASKIPALVLQYYPQGIEFQDGTVGLIGGWAAPGNVFFKTTTAALVSTNSCYVIGPGLGYNLLFPTVGEYYQESDNKIDVFEFNESEWTEAGKSTIDDGWFRALTSDGEGVEPFEVATYVNKEKSNLVLLKNPYKNSGYTTQKVTYDGTEYPVYEEDSREGYILLDLADSRVPMVVPYVNSGFISPEMIGPFRLCCTTSEGAMYYMMDYTIDDIIDEAEIYGDQLPTMEDNVITLPNCRIQGQTDDNRNYNLTIATQWTNSEGLPIDMNTVITVSKEALAGVNGVITDNENAPKRFFNLQGMEVANPEAGQLVIVKQGNKASKTIVR